ncbi:MAG: VOC family protein [Sphingomonadales bacterium]
MEGKYVEDSEQLVFEIYVNNVLQSLDFYTQLGFSISRADAKFAVLLWEDSMLFLEAVPDPPELPDQVAGNIRIMVHDVEALWDLVRAKKIPVLKAIADRDYGLRDFTILSPDGIGLRFASRKISAGR